MLHGLVVEGISGVFVLYAPEQRLMGILQSGAAKIRHGIGLGPDDVIEYPKAHVLHDAAEPVYVLKRPYHPDGSVFFHQSFALAEPG